MRYILRSMSNCVAALRSAIYVSTVRLARPIAFPISADVRGGFYFDGIELEAVSDVFGEYADTPGID